MADLEVAKQLEEERAREAAQYNGKGGGDIYATAAQLEAQGLGAALVGMNASGASVSGGEIAEIRRTVKDEGNRVME